MCIAYLLGCVLDADHFIPWLGGKPSVDGAMRLGQRPAGHAVLAIVVSAAVAAMLWRRTPLWALFLVAWGTHQVRDSLRRGLWLWPYGSTRAVPLRAYVAVVALLPLLMAALLLLCGYGAPVGAFAGKIRPGAATTTGQLPTDDVEAGAESSGLGSAGSSELALGSLALGSPSLRTGAAASRLRML